MDRANWTSFAADELDVRVVGKQLQFFSSVGSTNDLLKEQARLGAAEGLVFVTDEQVAGRGRRGRSWTAPAGTSLLVSMLLHPGWLPAGDAFLITILAAVAAAEAIESVTALDVDLKWPNDLQIEGRKLGGILVETEMSEAQLRWVVIGCGINVNWSPRAIPELAEIATSLSDELGRPIDRREVLRALLTRLDQRYDQLRQGARSALFDAWRSRLRTLGQSVRAETPSGPIFGVAHDVTLDGGLILRDDQGRQHIVMAGEVSIRTENKGTREQENK
ncbi:MAG: biotin--[acetyl-CoA-carboxylase] ligase [Chloroflexi bacterium]|nr:biotin--[acetyl-CoA-carboxylase] ligase [Chloroflexota bacterium]